MKRYQSVKLDTELESFDVAEFSEDFDEEVGDFLEEEVVSVKTLVVSWKDAADRKEFVANDALVIPSITCLPSA